MKRWLIVVLGMCSMGLQAQETVEMDYPRAEWSKAGDILMHTPGQELFNGESLGTVLNESSLTQNCPF